jgi:hypothetical protein
VPTIRVTRSGGLANLRQEATVDTDAIQDESQRREIEDLLARFPLEELAQGAQGAQAPARGADRYQYDVTIVDERGERTVSASEESLPPKLFDVVDWVLTHGSAGG